MNFLFLFGVSMRWVTLTSSYSEVVFLTLAYSLGSHHLSSFFFVDYFHFSIGSIPPKCDTEISMFLWKCRSYVVEPPSTWTP
jgi:hypothetical protein